MKKFFILTAVFITVLFGGCKKVSIQQANQSSVNEETTGNKIVESSTEMSGNIKKTDQNLNKVAGKKESISLIKLYSWEKISNYSWSFSMEKPDLSEMTNWDSILHWFHKKRSVKVLITPKDIETYSENYDDMTEEDDMVGRKKNVKIYICDISGKVKTITLTPKQQEEIFKGKKYYVTITGTYLWSGYIVNHTPRLLTLSNKQIDFFKKHWWVIIDPGWKTVDYSRESAEYGIDPTIESFEEEWNEFIRSIGWEKESYKRYPYNAVFISSDFLLHVFHKVFDNELKYKEESGLREKIWKIAKIEFEKYKKKYLTTNNKELKKLYWFLASYNAIASSLLLSWKQLFSGDFNHYDVEDLTDNQIKERVLNDLKNKISFLPKDTQDVIVKEMNFILDASEVKDDPLILHFFPNDKEFQSLNIKQDFTQFKPRSHYTSDALLKTYFMWMKWLMREKFYFKSSNLSKAALILANNLDEKELTELRKIQDFVTKLIWTDDDVNIFDLRKFAKDNNLLTDQDIVNKFNKDIQNKLLRLKEQKIISTVYTTQTIWDKTEKQAHDDTVGFSFFGEKFTIDSWIFDKLTAWSAEKEQKEKPSITTALVIPYILNNNSVAGKLTKIWLKNNLKDNPEKVNGYLKVAKDLIQKVQYFDFSKNIYSQWLDTLNYVFVKFEGNKPYWLKDKLYKLRQLLTYMGSYTELKHDTQLYVKESYAEIWWWGFDCIEVDPPSLPVPKWYVEPNIDLIDKLIKLSSETYKVMNSYKFLVLKKKLEFLKKIALAEIKNEKISDEDFEKLRLINFIDILIPRKVIGMPLQKEERWALISDIFTSSDAWTLYEALWRPNLILLMIKDINGARVVLWPVYTHYEFYKKGERLTDENWQEDYDENFKDDDRLKSLEYRFLEKEIKK